ncbi:MAG: VWA domain-containing protein [Terracidiphilus sp.]|nr:VWA domain-containing protein [Terracidiphilus sp.]
MSNSVRAVLSLVFLCTPLGFSQQAAAPAANAAAQTPTQAVAPTRTSLDVLVTDKAGKPVPDLEPMDFSLLDNGQPRKILSFRRTNGIAGNSFDPPVQVIFVLDAVNMNYRVDNLVRQQLGRFLRQNGGRLAQPTSLFILTSKGLQVQPVPSRDGNALADVAEKATGLMRAEGSASDLEGQEDMFRKSLNALAGIAENEARVPGRKMIVWLGPGWSLLNDVRIVETKESRQGYFRLILSMSAKLREARITLYCIFPVAGIISQGMYESFLKPIVDPHKAAPGNLCLPVLARQSGGRVIDASNDVAGQLADCIGDIGTYYTISFAAPAAVAANEYHDLKVVVAQPGLASRTSSGYYNQP